RLTHPESLADARHEGGLARTQRALHDDDVAGTQQRGQRPAEGSGLGIGGTSKRERTTGHRCCEDRRSRRTHRMPKTAATASATAWNTNSFRWSGSTATPGPTRDAK